MGYLGFLRDRRIIVLMAVVSLLPVFWFIGNLGNMAIPQLSKEPLNDISPLKNEQRIVEEVIPNEATTRSWKSEPAGIAAEDSIGFSVLPAIGDRIIKTATISLKVKDAFSKTYDKTTRLARTYGGQVMTSNLSTENSGYTGTITIKVPTDSFEKLISDMKNLGKVNSIDIVSQDVSEEYVDLESRVKHLKAQEDVLLAFMTKAESISDSIAIQSQLSGIQQQIEQATGRLNFLKNRTDFSTVQIMINDPAPISTIPVDEWGFGAALEKSAHAAINTINGFIIFIGYILPLVLIGSIIYVIVNIARRNHDRKESTVV